MEYHDDIFLVGKKKIKTGLEENGKAEGGIRKNGKTKIAGFGCLHF